jgi:hypothetical protein
MTQAGWYPDPTNPSQQRWWDGTAWTAHSAPLPAMATPPPPTWAPRYVGDTAVVDASALIAGFAPSACAPHGRTGSTAKITFQSRTPWWVWITLVAGVLIALLVALLMRKTATAPAWPVCDECRKERRTSQLWACLAGALWLPTVWVGASVAELLPDGPNILLIIVAFLVPIVLVLWLATRASYAARLKGVVSQDGRTVVFPAAVFAGARGASSALSGRPGSAGQTTSVLSAPSVGQASTYNGDTILPGR